VSITPEISRH